MTFGRFHEETSSLPEANAFTHSFIEPWRETTSDIASARPVSVPIEPLTLPEHATVPVRASNRPSTTDSGLESIEQRFVTMLQREALLAVVARDDTSRLEDSSCPSERMHPGKDDGRSRQ